MNSYLCFADGQVRNILKASMAISWASSTEACDSKPEEAEIKSST